MKEATMHLWASTLNELIIRNLFLENLQSICLKVSERFRPLILKEIQCFAGK
jgi:hypothetical protein